MNSLKLAKKIRINCIKMVNLGKSSHIGSALSIVDILSVLYGGILNFDPKKPLNEERDRFILSKGHAGVAVYATLAEVGFFSTEVLKTHCQNGSKLSGHVSHKDVPGVEFSTGSLGHGLPVACGIAMAGKIAESSFNVYVLLGDGELDEGSNWEAMMFASHHKLNNLTVIIDRNNLQSITTTDKTLNLEPLEAKLMSFGMDVSVVDGHDHIELYESLKTKSEKPKLIIANTTKGKGVSFMENSVDWHYKTPLGVYFDRAIQEINESSL